MPPARKPARPLASPEEVAEYLGPKITTDTLKDWRYKGTGPAYIRAGKHVRYDWADVEAWVAACRVERSQSDGAGRPAA